MQCEQRFLKIQKREVTESSFNWSYLPNGRGILNPFDQCDRIKNTLLHFPKKSFFCNLDKYTICACLAVDGVSKILLGHPDQARSKEKSYRHPIVKSEHLQNITSQELQILSSVTIDCQVTKIVMNPGSQLSVL